MKRQTFFLIFFSCVVALSAYIFFTQKTDAPVEEKQDAANELAIDTSDWKTYINEEYGFGFRYPTNWRVNVLNTEKSSRLLSGPLQIVQLFEGEEMQMVFLPEGEYDHGLEDSIISRGSLGGKETKVFDSQYRHVVVVVSYPFETAQFRIETAFSADDISKKQVVNAIEKSFIFLP